MIHIDLLEMNSSPYNGEYYHIKLAGDMSFNLFKSSLLALRKVLLVNREYKITKNDIREYLDKTGVSFPKELVNTIVSDHRLASTPIILVTVERGQKGIISLKIDDKTPAKESMTYRQTVYASRFFRRGDIKPSTPHRDRSTKGRTEDSLNRKSKTMEYRKRINGWRSCWIDLKTKKYIMDRITKKEMSDELRYYA